MQRWEFKTHAKRESLPGFHFLFCSIWLAFFLLLLPPESIAISKEPSQSFPMVDRTSAANMGPQMAILQTTDRSFSCYINLTKLPKEDARKYYPEFLEAESPESPESNTVPWTPGEHSLEPPQHLDPCSAEAHNAIVHMAEVALPKLEVAMLPLAVGLIASSCSPGFALGAGLSIADYLMNNDNQSIAWDGGGALGLYKAHQIAEAAQSEPPKVLKSIAIRGKHYQPQRLPKLRSLVAGSVSGVACSFISYELGYRASYIVHYMFSKIP